MLSATSSNGLFFIDSKDRYLYHYTKSKTALCKILPSGTLRMSPFTETKDPRENKDWVFGLGTAQQQGFAGAPIEETETIMRGRATKLAKSTCKLLCFTEDEEQGVPGGIGAIYARGFCHPRMWAQYAEAYTGVCMIFDREQLRNAIRRSLESTSLVRSPLRFLRTEPESHRRGPRF